MMIIDADTHITPTAAEFSIEQLLSAMDRADVEKALTWLRPDYHREEIEGHNAYVHRAMKTHPDRILGFGWADPTVSVAHAKEMVKRCVEDYGFYGVKLNGAQNYYHIDDPDLALPVIDEIAKTGTMLAFHTGSDAYSQTHPYRVGNIARQYPDTPILMVHMGGVRIPNLCREAIEVATQYPNITLIGSAAPAKDVLRAIKILGASRLCFGSDAPFALMHVEVAKYRALLDGEISTEEQDLVMWGNLARLFNLEL
jgi:predicted TIM-barrel fold metal-dependent hydrolase